MTASTDFEVIIIGGSYAGLSAALALGRSLRKVLVIDSEKPCNNQTPHSHNFLTQDGQTPAAISALAKKQVKKYETVAFFQGIATNGIKMGEGFEITTDKQKKFTARKLIFATGIKDVMPSIKGFAECWGISVIHCPYCHGYEFKGKQTGIFANGERGFHLASLVHNLTNNVTLLTNGKADFTKEQIAQLKHHKIEIIEKAVTEVKHEMGKINQVVFADGTKKWLDALYAALPFVQHSGIPDSLGCELTEQGYIKVSPLQETNIEGVFACGDNVNMMRSVANAVYSGNLTGAVVNGKLTIEKF
ncbi:pyridine nucleotide-disulfide oxidoreductase [Aequorivita soesokkakensis]|uniref:Pyridine nucleotide-disulfide oxidoreductase n=1 Tax=Aequorivita soesokkakensis TaxID=1385699 RepID=A0A1A9LEH7_9FLAO|nr:NAD(P)/FAD-dependent oxidoreductase [Aequorivita soesokkakensis]OAD91487.1 pyridine nucleotide-disulfide oxidoreductase [Aequorivita soesokkakensis]